MINVSNKNAVLFSHGKAGVYNSTCNPCSVLHYTDNANKWYILDTKL